jgi:ubiquinone/menaquinone biosynthesis C-methylase UbiE
MSLLRLNEALAEIYRVLKPGGLYFASTFFVDGLKKVPTGGGFSTFESTEELDGLVKKAGFSNSGGATVRLTQKLILDPYPKHQP